MGKMQGHYEAYWQTSYFKQVTSFCNIPPFVSLLPFPLPSSFLFPTFLIFFLISNERLIFKKKKKEAKKSGKYSNQAKKVANNVVV